MFCPQVWGRKWLRQFYGRLEKMCSFCRKKTHAHKIPRCWGGGGILGFFFGGGGGGSADFILWARGFFSGTKIQPKEEVFGRTSLRTSRQKLRSGPPNPGKTSISERAFHADVREKNFGLKNFGLIFRSLFSDTKTIIRVFFHGDFGQRSSHCVMHASC